MLFSRRNTLDWQRALAIMTNLTPIMEDYGGVLPKIEMTEGKKAIIFIDLFVLLCLENNKGLGTAGIVRVCDKEHYIVHRPYVEDFVKVLSSVADLVIYSDLVEEEGEACFETLGSLKECFKYRLYGDACWETELFRTKPVAHFGLDMSKVILIDPLYSNTCTTWQNAINLRQYEGTPDNQLKVLSNDLMKIIEREDVRQGIEIYFPENSRLVKERLEAEKKQTIYL
jgi:hypothetical protein